MSELQALARGVIAAGFDGAAFDERLPCFGGYVLFARNCPTLAGLRALTEALRERRFDGTAPLIAIDQEGGRVVRLRDGIEAMPSMMALGATGDAELAARAGEQTAFDLRRAGCTMDLAPVLDLALDPANTVIGTRSLGADPQAVAALGQAYADGLERGGVLACHKHFPGHGSTAVDSHLALPAIEADAETLRTRDLVPFVRVARRARAIMGAHAVFRAFDPDRPATLSPAIAGDLLRGELGFPGAFVTDCLEMTAVAGERGSLVSGVAALCAGADLLLVSRDRELADQLARAIVQAVTDGALPLSRLQEAHERVVRLRQDAAPALPLDAFSPHPGIGREIARRAVTLVRGLPHADPLATCAVDFSDGAADEPSLAREAPALTSIRAGLEPEDGIALLDRIAESRRRPLLLARRAHLHAGQARAIAQILERYPDAIAVSLLEPFDIPLLAGARHVLAAYGDDSASLGGLADVLFGGSPAQGSLPVAVAVGV